MSESLRTPRGAWAGWVVALAICGPSFADLPGYLTIKGDGRELGETPLIVESKEPLKPGTYQLTSDDGKSVQLADVFQDGGKTYLGTVLEKVPGQGTIALKIPYVTRPDSPGSGVELIPDGKRIKVQVNGKPLTEYIPDDGPKPYYFPLFGPTGAAMTRAYPMMKVEGEKYDHLFQRSFWFTLTGSGRQQGRLLERSGRTRSRIVETSRPTVVGGRGDGHDAGRPTTGSGPDGKKVCEDERVVRIYATKKDRVLDFDITLKASEGPVTFGDTKEGMFGVRVATSMDVTAKKGGKILNAEGVEDTKAWGKPSPWVDYTGPVEGKTVGIAILNHSSSFRYPTTWHVRDYGLFAANPFGWHDFGQKTSGEYVLPKGESIRFRYRVILHEGTTDEAALPTAFQ